jgi:hypothetical protein
MHGMWDICVLCMHGTLVGHAAWNMDRHTGTAPACACAWHAHAHDAKCVHVGHCSDCACVVHARTQGPSCAPTPSPITLQGGCEDGGGGEVSNGNMGVNGTDAQTQGG